MTYAGAAPPHPDRLFPADPGVRDVARRLHEHVRSAPIVSPHGHIDAAMLAGDVAFRDPTALLISPDHYVFRLLHAAGVGLAELGVGGTPLTAEQARSAWRLFCSHWSLFAGTPVRYWLEVELAEVFGIDDRPSARNADDLYDRIAALLATPEYRPRALFERFGIEVLATTDDPCDDLAAHRALRADPGWHGRVVPTFRPDATLDPAQPAWLTSVARLEETTGHDTGHYRGFIAALEDRRRYFRDHGGVSTDHSYPDAGTESLEPSECEQLYRNAVAGRGTSAEAVAFRRHMMGEMARMSCDDGLVMTLHPGVSRDHHTATHRAFGSDAGNDIPVAVEFTRALRPLLQRYGTHPNLHLVLFTMDETVFSREIAPLAGFYPAVYVGAPWWFLDAPEAIRRFRGAVTETVGFSRTTGFIDDTRAFCSVPARHDLSRRIDAGYLAGLVAEHRLAEEEAFDIAMDLVSTNPRRAFKL